MGRKRKFPKHKQKSPKWYQSENQWGDFVFDWSLGLEGETWREIFAVVVLIIAVVIALGFFGSAGTVGESSINFAKKIFGATGAYFFTLAFFYLGIILLAPTKKGKKYYRISRFLGVFLFLIFLSSLLHLFIPVEDALDAAKLFKGGGLVGYAVSVPLRNAIGLFPAFLASITFLVVAFLMTFNISLTKLFSGEREDEETGASKVNINTGTAMPVKISFWGLILNRIKGRKPIQGPMISRAPVLEVDATTSIMKPEAGWVFPLIDEILLSADEAPNPGNINKNVESIQKCMANFGIEIHMSDVNVGPSVTQYTFKPTEGVKLNQIVARQTDLALALSAKSLRIEAPIPGKNLVGVEIANTVSAKVTLKEILKSKNFRNLKSKLAIALGRDVSGEPISIDLELMPHLLIAGATGSGKSVCINAIICAYLFNNTPKDLRILLVDPKRVELTNYNGIPHLLAPVVTDVDKTVSALKWAVWEMERRYKLFSELGKRNISAYNAAPGSEGKLPYIIVIIDELADLMAASAKEVEGSIVRLAQMARATGIHLIIATQRPSVDVLTGLIKANMPSRIAFATASQVDSRTILDLSGAEKLLGNGDMLFIANGINKPKRIQGCFVSDEEIEELNKFLRDKGEASYDETILSFRPAGAGRASGGEYEEDDLYNEAVEEVVRAGKASASLLQRRIRVGYARAARLLDILEQRGVIGPSEGAKPRDVLISDPSMATFTPDISNRSGGIPPSFGAEPDQSDYPEEEISNNNR